MTTTKKLAIAVVALSLVLVGVIGGTLAYLIAESNTVTNTFTYGNIALTLEETKGTLNGKVREFTNVVPGAEIEKDPTITVTANSENCWVYAKVINNVVLDDETVVTCNVDTTVWIPVGSETNNDGSVVSLYRYKEEVAKSNGDQKLPALFESVTFSTGIESEDIATLDAITEDIVITAYAHQAAGVKSEDADAEAIKWAGVTAITTQP